MSHRSRRTGCMFLPRRCVLCRRSGAALCASCAAGLVPGPRGPIPAAYTYVGPARQALAALKFRDARAIVPVLASAMAVLVPAEVDMVTWAPTSASRRRVRGFDQAELLARAVARERGLPCRRLLVRVGHSRAQTGRGRAARLEGPAFRAVRPISHRVLVVDDVVTTGSTLARATEALYAAGAPLTSCVAAAATPYLRGSTAPGRS